MQDPTPLSDFVHKLCETTDAVEAQILKDFLGGQGVDALVLGDYLSGAAGELPVNIFPSVWVMDEADLGRARDLLRCFRQPPASDDSADRWVCKSCSEQVEGQFVLCWNCGAPRHR